GEGPAHAKRRFQVKAQHRSLSKKSVGNNVQQLARAAFEGDALLLELLSLLVGQLSLHDFTADVELRAGVVSRENVFQDVGQSTVLETVCPVAGDERFGKPAEYARGRHLVVTPRVVAGHLVE